MKKKLVAMSLALTLLLPIAVSADTITPGMHSHIASDNTLTEETINGLMPFLQSFASEEIFWVVYSYKKPSAENTVESTARTRLSEHDYPEKTVLIYLTEEGNSSVLLIGDQVKPLFSQDRLVQMEAVLKADTDNTQKVLDFSTQLMLAIYVDNSRPCTLPVYRALLDNGYLSKLAPGASTQGVRTLLEPEAYALLGVLAALNLLQLFRYRRVKKNEKA